MYDKLDSDTCQQLESTQKHIFTNLLTVRNDFKNYDFVYVKTTGSSKKFQLYRVHNLYSLVIENIATAIMRIRQRIKLQVNGIGQ